MKSAGYATAVAGKWQLAMLGRDLDHPRKLGFDEYSLFGWHEGPRYYEPHIWQNGKLRTDVKDQFGPDVYTDFLIDFIKRKQGQPFFAFYSMALCHDVTDDLKSPVPFGPGKDQYDSYKEMIESMDRCVGRLTAALDRLKLRDKTLVVFTTDNGTPVSSIARVKDGKRLVRDPVFSNIGKKRVRGGKGKLTNAGTNVPLIVSWPGHAKAGTVVDDLADFSDFFVTFAELGGAALPRDVALDGQSFACRLRDNTPAPRKWAFAEGRGGKHWVRTARWKLYNDGRLFDVPNDLLEKSPLKSNALSDEAAKARAELQLALESLTE
jgi:arylsulfatase A